jgi:hypothetical protein
MNLPILASAAGEPCKPAVGYDECWAAYTDMASLIGSGLQVLLLHRSLLEEGTSWEIFLTEHATELAQNSSAYLLIDAPEAPLAPLQDALKSKHANIYRYNGLARPEKTLPEMRAVLEIAAHGGTGLPRALTELLTQCGVIPIAAPDCVGMYSARVIGCIIAEAYRLKQEQGTSEADIDLAMKLGTGYPIGPFEWETLWGKSRTEALLNALERENLERYGR